MNDINLREIERNALEVSNLLFEKAGYNFRVSKLTIADLDWCRAMSRQQPKNKWIPWEFMGSLFYHKNSFNFSFKLLDLSNKPAAACMCQYSKVINAEQDYLDVEMIQNFAIKTSVLDGNTFRFALYTLIFFMRDARCHGIRVMSPINSKVADYYINKYNFVDILGSKEILYRDSKSLSAWLRVDVESRKSLIVSEQLLSDNENNDVNECLEE